MKPLFLAFLLLLSVSLASAQSVYATPYTFTTLAGLAYNIGHDDGTGSAAQFHRPNGVAVDARGNVYVADTYNYTIRKITPAGVVSTLAGLAGSNGSSDGTGSAARFYYPFGVTVDTKGNVYVADTDNQTIRKITPAGVVSTLAGLAGSSGNSDGIGSVARFNFPSGVAVDANGNVYVADTYNALIRKITPTGVVSTLAGLVGVGGSSDGTGSAARFSEPFGVAVDASGNVFVADTYNSLIRKITPAGVVSTLAGLAGSSGNSDGTGSAARFNFPSGVAVDASGNVFVADTVNNTIRKITQAGVVSTLAGLAGTYDYSDGTGSAAGFGEPSSVAVDASGKLYVADAFYATIRVGTREAPPVITSALTLTGAVNVPLSYQTTATYFPTSYSVTGTLPPGLTFYTDHGLSLDASPGHLSGTPTQGGTFKLTLKATNGAGSGTAVLTLTIVKTSQAITFPTVGSFSFGTQYTLAAKASSGLAVTYPAVHGQATISGNQLTFTGVGMVVVKCRQSGNGTYAAAPDLDVTLNVVKAAQTITAPAGGSVPFGTPYTLAATASSGLAVTYPSIHGPATLSGNQLTFTGVGMVTVKCRQGGNANYSPASDITLTLTVVKTPQTLTFPHIGAVKVGQVVTLAATSSSGLPITYQITAGSGVVKGNTVTFSATGVATIAATQAGTATIAPATVAQNVSVR